MVGTIQTFRVRSNSRKHSFSFGISVRVRDRNAVSERQTATAVLDITVVDVNDNAPRFEEDIFQVEIYENNAVTELRFPVTDADRVTDPRFRLQEENQFVSVGMSELTVFQSLYICFTFLYICCTFFI